MFASFRSAAGLLAALPVAAFSQAPGDAPLHTLERITVTGGRPSTLPLEIPTTTEGISGRQVAQTINATDAQDALKYFPSLLVRKRYIGDHDHAVLATRASGTGNSARSLVYADGILLSNLLGNGASFTPRWGLVTPEEIERVDVLYGPFSAAYSGHSVGAVVDYVTRMPTRLEAHVKLQGFSQRFKLDGIDDRFSGGAASASIGSREGAWAWWVNVNRLDSQSHPLSFVTKTRASGSTTGSGTPVTGALAGHSPVGAPWWIVGNTGQTHTVQDHAKLKVAHDLTPTLRAAYTLGHWRGDNQRVAASHLRDAAGAPVSAGTVTLDGLNYTLGANDFAPSSSRLEHWMQGLSLASHTRGTWDWAAAFSSYRYREDTLTSAATPIPGSSATSAGHTDQSGSGWRTWALKGIWRPEGVAGAHVVEFGAQQDAYRLRTVIPRAVGTTTYGAEAELRSLWAQDAWRFAPAWRAVLGLRAEQWRAFNARFAPAPVPVTGVPVFTERDETHASPKAAVSYQWNDDWTLKASLGRAVRMPTLTELYQVQGTDPHLRPERSWTSEWSAERELQRGLLRATVFAERTRDALYAQRKDIGGGTLVNAVQNVDAIRTLGAELAAQASDVLLRGIDLSGSLTYADSRITRNDAFAASVGHWQPRVPRWRANLLATWRASDAWQLTYGSRYSGKQYGTLDNSDPNGSSYTGFSRFWVSDVRAQYRIDKSWTASLGIDNLNNATYWAFHPYTQRTVHAELRFDL